MDYMSSMQKAISYMDYKIVKRDSFKLLAKVESFRNETAISEGDSREIPDFWKRCQQEGVFNVLVRHTTKHDTYGVCSPISKESDYFEYGIGMVYDEGSIPEGYRLWEVRPTLWAVFRCIGENPECIGDTWNRIFKEFLPTSEYVMLDDTDFELYPEKEEKECFCEIWIPIEKKK